MQTIRRLALTIIIYPLVVLHCFSQTNEWAWMGGDSLLNFKPVYGVKGIAAPGNKPGVRYWSVSWTDNDGNFWMFGGYGCATGGNAQAWLNDLWKYSPAINQWAWMGGDSTLSVRGVYGTQGIAAPGNKPGGRQSAAGWKDKAGNLWLFSGEGYNASVLTYLNDLWMYNVADNEWTWVSGSSGGNGQAVYGTLGIADTSNIPAPRTAAASWTDTAGNLWLFGGYVYGPTVNYYCRNDLWKYTIATNEWTWEGGDSAAATDYAVYGTQGIPATGNIPTGRMNPAIWTDNAGNVWLFGGYAFNSGYLSDLWMYNPASNQWAWIGGDTVTVNGVYGTKGVPASGNLPRSRQSALTWNDRAGNLFLFGGEAGPSFPVSGIDDMNDLWRYNIDSGEWTWISGTDTYDVTGTYGTRGIADSANFPGGRTNAVRWTDNAGNFWLFGGNGYNVRDTTHGVDLNDLWVYRPPNTVPAPVARFTSPDTMVCMGSEVSFTDSSTGSATSWNWTFIGATPGTSTNQNPTVTYTTAGNYPVTLVVNNLGGSDSLTKTGYIAVNPLPVPVITAGDTVFCSGDSTQVCTGDTFATYLWNTGNTSFCTPAYDAGGYWVTVTDANHCSAVSGHQEISIYPVPSVSIVRNGDTLSSYAQVSYQWILNGILTGDTNSFITARQAGSYAVQVTDTNGCTATSSAVVITGINGLAGEESVSLYPNPVSAGSIRLEVSSELAGSALEIYDDNGRLVFQSEIRDLKSEINFNVAKGIYWLRIASANASIVRKLVKI